MLQRNYNIINGRRGLLILLGVVVFFFLAGFGCGRFFNNNKEVLTDDELAVVKAKIVPLRDAIAEVSNLPAFYGYDEDGSVTTDPGLHWQNDGLAGRAIADLDLCVGKAMDARKRVVKRYARKAKHSVRRYLRWLKKHDRRFEASTEQDYQDAVARLKSCWKRHKRRLGNNRLFKQR
ncbi:hypothetical protein GF367_01550 [Candidatus Woesearchaeota archaeon]|nr:hypothetical protein [Candidatus Woesearchaeota archaeon]